MTTVVMICLAIACIIVVATAGVLAWRRRRSLRPARSSPTSNWPTRLIESGALAAIGVTVLVPIVYDETLYQSLDLAMPAVVEGYFLGLALLGAALLLAVIAAAYRPWLGALLLLIIGGWAAQWWMFEANPPGWIRLIDPAQRKRAEHLVLGERVPYDDVQLYVNGVHLGEAPVRIPVDEFREKVPEWKNPPDGLTERDLRHARMYQRDRERPWGMFVIQPRDHGLSVRSQATGPDEQYYIQARLDDEWARIRSDTSATLARGTAYHAVIQQSLQFNFPEHDEQADERMRELVAQAEQRDLRVDDAWVRNMARVPNAFDRLTDLAEDRSALYELRRNWALHHYDLNYVDDADTAWQTLQTLHHDFERDDAGTALAEVAVRTITPMLDVDRLVATARELVVSGRLSGRFHSRDGWSEVVGIAVREMDRHLDKQNDTEPNAIEERVYSAMIYANPTNGKAFQYAVDLAIDLGWPDGYRFMMRQPWQRRAHSRADPFAMRVGRGNERYINYWLFRLLRLDTPDGRRFRAQHDYLLRETADTIVESFSIGSVDMEELQFLFLDPQLGKQSPGMQYWPRFIELTNVPHDGSGEWGLRSRVEYLVELEPVSTVPMYVEALRVTRGACNDFSASRLEALPPDKRRAVLKAWIAELEQILQNPPSPIQPWMQPENINRITMLPGLKRRLIEDSE